MIVPPRKGRRCPQREHNDEQLHPNVLAELVFGSPWWGSPSLLTDDDRQRAWRRWGPTIIADMEQDYPESIAYAIRRLGNPQTDN